MAMLPMTLCDPKLQTVPITVFFGHFSYLNNGWT